MFAKSLAKLLGRNFVAFFFLKYYSARSCDQNPKKVLKE